MTRTVMIVTVMPCDSRRGRRCKCMQMLENKLQNDVFGGTDCGRTFPIIKSRVESATVKGPWSTFHRYAGVLPITGLIKVCTMPKNSCGKRSVQWK